MVGGGRGWNAAAGVGRLVFRARRGAADGVGNGEEIDDSSGALAGDAAQVFRDCAGPGGARPDGDGRTCAPGQCLLPGSAVVRLSLSPDGKRVAYISRGHLWIAGIGGEAPTIYDEATGTPFWSPDGRFVAASTGKELRRFEVGTQNTTSIGAVNTNFSGAWSKSGTILIGLMRDGLYRVPADGGAMQRVTSVDASRGETRHIALQFLPDGRHFLFLAGSHVPVGACSTPGRSIRRSGRR